MVDTLTLDAPNFHAKVHGLRQNIAGLSFQSVHVVESGHEIALNIAQAINQPLLSTSRGYG